MALESVSPLLGQGGVGLNDQLGGVVTELQGLKIDVLTGAAADTKMDLAAIRDVDTIIAAVEMSAASNPVDQTANMSIASVVATGTLTIVTAGDGDTAEVRGVTYTFKDAPTELTDVRRVDADDNANASRLADAINRYETRYSEGWVEAQVTANAATNVVTVTAVDEGTAANSFSLAGTGGVTPSGATLTGGDTTGGVLCTADLSSNVLMVWWMDKA